MNEDVLYALGALVAWLRYVELHPGWGGGEAWADHLEEIIGRLPQAPDSPLSAS
jgi:hypothetical protein